jgi:hypothetical protein
MSQSWEAKIFPKPVKLLGKKFHSEFHVWNSRIPSISERDTAQALARAARKARHMKLWRA